MSSCILVTRLEQPLSGPCDMAQFVPSEGKTLITNEGGEVSLFADFSLKFVGEVHGRKAQGEYEGHWLASLTGFVFSQKITRSV